MVELTEVEDESFETKQAGPSDDEDYYTDTGSSFLSQRYAYKPNNPISQTLRSPAKARTMLRTRKHLQIDY
jgi:hypothetical protein